MFFMRLRKRAKWVFVLLAAMFGIGFIGFGVGGQGGGGVADVISGIFGQDGSAQTSVNDAQSALADNPDDPDARRDLAQALNASQRFDEAIPAYVSYLELEPDNTQGLQELALLYQADVGEALQRATVLQQDALTADPGSAMLFDPNSTPFTQQLAANQLTAAIAAGANREAETAFDEAAVLALPWVATLNRIADLSPNSPTLQLQLGQAYETADDADGAIAAYIRALELDPAGTAAIQVRERVIQLGGVVPALLNQEIDDRAAEMQIDPNAPIFEQPNEGGVAPDPTG
jgi:tetratricopeptide (TPR) repeat protein